jgi:transcriptional regulator with XRE-family HTH domain
VQHENLNLGTKVANSRKKLGLSQEALAEKANVSLSTIQRIEKGAVKPRAFTIKILAEILVLDISELISDPAKREDYKPLFSSLKRMNLATLFFAFVPFLNLAIPILVWKSTKQIQPNDMISGKIVSFQLLWSIVTIIGMGIALFTSNLIIGEAGNGLFISILFYLLAVLFNVFTIAKTSSQLNNENDNTLSFVPNLF